MSISSNFLLFLPLLLTLSLTLALFGLMLFRTSELFPLALLLT